MLLTFSVKQLDSLSDIELRQLGSYIGINIDIIAGQNKNKRTVLANYIAYAQLQNDVRVWFKQHYPIAISYPYSKDIWAHELNEYLSLKGFRPIIDRSNIDLTGRSIITFETLLSEQPIFLAILNDKYLHSLNCMRELYLFASRYNFDISKACYHFIAIWENNLDLSIAKITKIANSWKCKLDKQNGLIANHKCSVREKMMDELDWYAKIYHRCINLLYMIKDTSAVVIQGEFMDYLPDIENIIEAKLQIAT